MRNIWIKGTKMNNLTLIVEGVKVGKLDVDHNKIYLDYTEEYWNNVLFPREYNPIDIAFEVANYYDEIEIVDDEVIPTVKYEVIYDEEEVEE